MQEVMWESPQRFSRSGGRVGKQLHRFPMLSTDRHFHRLSRSSLHSGRDLRRGALPVLLELDRADVVQRRVHACLVLPEQLADGFILGFADGSKALTVQPLHHQRAEQCPTAGLVPAVALAAHRRRNAELLQQLAEVVAGVLAASVAPPACPDSAGTMPSPRHR